MWNFDGLNAAGAVVTTARATVRGGASVSPDDACCWTLTLPGCVVRVRFAVQFSGTAVRLQLFRIATGTTCTGVQIAEAFGTGTANATFPSAVQASGTSRLIVSAPRLGQGGGDARWQARRVE